MSETAITVEDLRRYALTRTIRTEYPGLALVLEWAASEIERLTIKPEEWVEVPAWAVIGPGGLPAAGCVGRSRREAIVKALMAGGMMALPWTTDQQVEDMWAANCGISTCEPVVIRWKSHKRG
jgi:hypothetical protein